MTNEPESRIAKLRETSQASEDKARKDKAALLDAAVEEAMTSTAYGHLSAVAREAGIAAQYLRTLIENQHPGWLDQAAEQRKAAKEGGGRTARGTRKNSAAAAA